MPSRECPKCLCATVADSRSRYYELPLGWMAMKPYRCCRCEHRFWRHSDRQSQKVLPYFKIAVWILGILALVVAILVYLLGIEHA